MILVRSAFRKGSLFLPAILALALCSCDADSTQPSSNRASQAHGAPPLVVMTIGSWTQPVLGTSNPEFPAGAQAAATAANLRGGISGRQIEVIVCSDELNPEVARQCAREAVRLHVAAVVGLQTFNETAVLPILEAEGIPAIGVFPFTRSALTSPISYPLTSGFIGQTTGMGVQLARSGAGIVRAVVPGGMGSINTEIGKLVNAGTIAGGSRFGGLVQIPAKSLDISPVVAAATGDGAGVAGLATDEAELIRSMRMLAPGSLLTTYPFNLTANVLHSAGRKAEGVLSVDGFLPPSANSVGTMRFRRELRAFDASMQESATGLHEWLAMDLFIKVARRTTDPTARGVKAAMDQLRNEDMGGVVPPLTTTEVPGPFPRLFNRTVVFEKVLGNHIVLQNPKTAPFVDIGPVMRSLPK